MGKDDFFEERSGKEPVKGKKRSKKSARKPQGANANLPNLVNLYLAIALIVVAFVVGFFVRGLVWPSTESSIPIESTPTEAPPLTQEQIEQGQIPPGHPQVTPSETDTTPSETDTTPSETP